MTDRSGGVGRRHVVALLGTFVAGAGSVLTLADSPDRSAPTVRRRFGYGGSVVEVPIGTGPDAEPNGQRTSSRPDADYQPYGEFGYGG